MYSKSCSFFFFFFLTEITVGIEAVGKHGIQLQPGLVEVFLLLFSSDLALLSSTAMGLQNQLNHLNSVCKEHSLCVNSEKYKIMVFRKGGFLKRWFLEGNILEVVNSYTYHCYTFTIKFKYFSRC